MNRAQALLAATVWLPRFVLAKLFVWSGLYRRFTIPQQGFRLRFYPTRLSAILWANPRDRERDVRFVQQYLRPGEVVVDVGANIGVVTLAASVAVGPTGRVIAIEPHPETAGHLRGNIAFNDARNVEVHNVAVGCADGTVGFSSRGADDKNCVRWTRGDIQVPISRLDRLLAGVATIHLLKVDVEGYEKFVFEGGTSVLARTRCVYFESCERLSSRYGVRSAAVIRLLALHGLQVFRFTDADRVSPVSDGYSSRALENLLAVREPEDFFRRTRYGST